MQVAGRACFQPAIRRLVLAVMLAGLGGCAVVAPASGPAAAPADPRPYALREPQPPLPLPPPAPATLPFIDAESLLPDLERLYPLIGGYPPRYKSAAERTTAYRQWSTLLQAARAAARREGDSEPARYLLAELFRIGHNMDVSGAAELAQRQIHDCLAEYPQSIACHFSAVRYALSVAPLQLDAAERSLAQLRSHFGSAFNEEVERGYVFLAVYRRDPVAARRQIDDFLALFPDSPFRASFELMRKALEQGRVEIDESLR